MSLNGLSPLFSLFCSPTLIQRVENVETNDKPCEALTKKEWDRQWTGKAEDPVAIADIHFHLKMVSVSNSGKLMGGTWHRPVT